MNRLLLLALALFAAFVVVAPRALPRWLDAVVAADVGTTNGACIDPDGNKIVPPPSGCPAP
jgi:hypothetical protein